MSEEDTPLPEDPGTLLLEFRMDALQRENEALEKRIAQLEHAQSIARLYIRKLNKVILERMQMTGAREPSIEEIYQELQRELWLDEIE